MNLKVANAKCYERQGAYLWVWEDYAGAWQARAAFRYEEKRCTRPLRTWGDVRVFLADLSASYLSLELPEHAEGLRQLSLAVLDTQLRSDQPLTETLVSWDGLKSLPCLAAVADDGSEAHLYQNGDRWHLWGESGGSGLAFRACGADPVRLLARLAESGAGLPPALLRQLLLALGPEQPPAPPEPPQPRPLPANLAERFGALVADLLAEGGAKAELGRRIIWLAADDDQAGPDYAGEDGWWGACEQVARDAFEHWVRRWDPLRSPPPVGPLDLLPEWGWQEAGRPEVWWGESSDDAEGAALAESARVGRSHRLLRVVAQTEVAPRGHWRMRPVGGDE